MSQSESIEAKPTSIELLSVKCDSLGLTLCMSVCECECVSQSTSLFWTINALFVVNDKKQNSNSLNYNKAIYIKDYYYYLCESVRE